MLVVGIKARACGLGLGLLGGAFLDMVARRAGIGAWSCRVCVPCPLLSSTGVLVCRLR